MFFFMLLNSKVNYILGENGLNGSKQTKPIKKSNKNVEWDLYLKCGDIVSCWSCLVHRG